MGTSGEGARTNSTDPTQDLRQKINQLERQVGQLLTLLREFEKILSLEPCVYRTIMVYTERRGLELHVVFKPICTAGINTECRYVSPRTCPIFLELTRQRRKNSTEAGTKK